MSHLTVSQIAAAGVATSVVLLQLHVETYLKDKSSGFQTNNEDYYRNLFRLDAIAQLYFFKDGNLDYLIGKIPREGVSVEESKEDNHGDDNDVIEAWNLSVEESILAERGYRDYEGEGVEESKEDNDDDDNDVTDWNLSVEESILAERGYRDYEEDCDEDGDYEEDSDEYGDYEEDNDDDDNDVIEENWNPILMGKQFLLKFIEVEKIDADLKNMSVEKAQKAIYNNGGLLPDSILYLGRSIFRDFNMLYKYTFYYKKKCS